MGRVVGQVEEIPHGVGMGPDGPALGTVVDLVVNRDPASRLGDEQHLLVLMGVRRGYLAGLEMTGYPAVRHSPVARSISRQPSHGC